MSQSLGSFRGSTIATWFSMCLFLADLIARACALGRTFLSVTVRARRSTISIFNNSSKNDGVGDFRGAQLISTTESEISVSMMASSHARTKSRVPAFDGVSNDIGVTGVSSLAPSNLATWNAYKNKSSVNIRNRFRLGGEIDLIIRLVSTKHSSFCLTTSDDDCPIKSQNLLYHVMQTLASPRVCN